ncbi:MAG: hypothetical protein HYT48_02480 [Candidatus Vogelbacteria bacterium]|nr:hypothetical protein [Candidatus Vogelbacteria bacterium]
MKPGLKICLAVVLGLLPLISLADWTAPPGTFPSGQVAPPIHTGLENQTKAGPLGIAVGNFPVGGLIRAFGGLFISADRGSLDPRAALNVMGQVRIRGGCTTDETPLNPSCAGKILTSDDTGLASWVDPAAAPQINYFQVKKSNDPNAPYTSNPITIARNERADLNWSASGAIACRASVSWSGPRELAGTELVTPQASTIYLLTCHGLFSSVTAGVTINVSGEVEPQPTTTLKVYRVNVNTVPFDNPPTTATVDGITPSPNPNPAPFSLAAGGHQVSVTKLAGYTVTARVCTYTTSECFTSSQGTDLAVNCGGSSCLSNVVLTANATTKAVFKYIQTQSTVGNIIVDRIGGPSTVTATVDCTNVNQGLCSGAQQQYPATFTSLAVGSSHTVRVTDGSGYSESVGTCSFASGQPECSVSTFNINPTCDGSTCAVNVSIAAVGYTTKVVVKYVALPFDFTLTNGGNKQVVAGSSVTNSVSATLSSGASQPVQFQVDNQAALNAAGITVIITPTTCSPFCQPSVTIQTSPTTP